MYAADRQFEPGEWCGRCNQTYTKADFELTFNIVTLFTDNIDLLNMLEKKDIHFHGTSLVGFPQMADKVELSVGL